MAVQSDTSSISYTGNNSTVTTYAVPFVFLENSHLAATAKVTATGVESVVTLTNHTGAGDANGGTVRTAVAVPATSTLTIFRTVPATQTTTYQEGGDFPAASHERALDKLTMLGQQNARRSDRAIRVTEADGSRNDMVAVANSIIGLDGSKQPKAMTASEVKTLLALTGVTLDVDAGMKTFADAGERALAVPDFTGQLGTQRDTGRIYISTGTVAGNWTLVNEDITLSDLSSGFFTADATGRGKFANGFLDTALIADSSSTTTGVTNAKLRQSEALSVIGRSANTSGAPADIAAANDGEVLRRSGTAIGFGQVATAGLADSAVTAAKLQNGCVVNTHYASITGIQTYSTGQTLAVGSAFTSADGVQILSVSNVTPASATNYCIISVDVYAGNLTSGAYYVIGLFAGSVLAASVGVYSNTDSAPVSFAYKHNFANASPVTFTVRAATSSGNLLINRSRIITTAEYNTGVQVSTMVIQEIKA